MADAEPVAALEAAARALAADPSETDAVRAAVKALFAALNDPGGLARWDAGERAACYRALIAQASCPVRPPILAHEAASAITAGNRAGAAALAREIGPALALLLAEDPDRTEGYANAVILLLVLRGLPGGAVPEAEVTRLHLDWFERFAPEDLSLPYSVMFNAESFGRNRDEILARHWPGRGLALAARGLSLPQVLFLEWLAGSDAFTDADNADLDAVLGARLPERAGELAAGRMLVLRHWRPGGVLDAARLGALGLGDVAALAARIAATREALPDAALTRAGAGWLSARPYQAAQAVLQSARARVPALRLGARRPRVAICVSGQLRGHERAFATWRQHILPHVEARFFVTSWRRIGRADARPARQVLPFAGRHFSQAYRPVAQAEGYEAMQARHPALFRALGSIADASEDRLKALYGTDRVVLDDETAAPFSGYSNQEKMHSKIQAADRMAREAGAFDLHVRLRPDLPVGIAGFDWRDLHDACRAAPRLFAEQPYGLHYNNLMIGDQCAIADPLTMKPYADAWEFFPDLAAARPARCPESFTGHISLALSAWVHGIRVEKAPFRFGALQEAAPLASDEILAALEEDSRGDAIDRDLIAAVRRDIGA